MKKKIFIGLGLIVTIVLIAVGTNYLMSLRKVSFVLHGDTTGVTVYGTDKKKLKQLTSSSSMFLKEGSYYAIPDGNNLSKDQINFTVGKTDTTVQINPAYSKEYLNGLLAKEKVAITTAIASKYPSVFNDYVLSKETLYGRGDWFGSLLKPKVSDIRQQKDPYRIVLQKKGGTWEVVRRPEYVLTSSKYKDVPIEILRAINSIVE